MNRTIIFRDGVFYDEEWNAITPTLDELTDITMAVNKYLNIKLKEAVNSHFRDRADESLVNVS